MPADGGTTKRGQDSAQRVGEEGIRTDQAPGPAVAAGLALTVAACDQGAFGLGKFDIGLSGSEEVCQRPSSCGGPGSGVATVDVNSDMRFVCYDIRLSSVKEVTAAHIHSGEKGEAGGVVVDLKYQGDDAGSKACVDGIDRVDLDRVAKDPDQYYLNVHSKEYPGGPPAAS